MNDQGLYYRSLFIIVILLSMSFSLSGCGHRSVYGTSHPQKMKKMGMDVSDLDQFSSLDELAADHSPLELENLATGKNKNDYDFLNDGVLTQEPLEEKGSEIKPLTSADLARQYWQQRRQAELMSHQSGLEDIYFELDSWELSEQARLALSKNAEFLRLNPENAVTIEGHCDERGTRAYNYVLGEKRALRVRNYLASLGVSPTQLTVMSYGKDNPLCRENSEVCFQENRRAHFLLGIKVADSRLWDDEHESVD